MGFVPVFHGFHRCSAPEDGLRQLGVVECDVSHEGLFQVEAAVEAVGFEHVCRVALKSALPQSVWGNGSIRALSNSGPARPYMARFRVFSRLIWPSV